MNFTAVVVAWIITALITHLFKVLRLSRARTECKEEEKDSKEDPLEKRIKCRLTGCISL